MSPSRQSLDTGAPQARSTHAARLFWQKTLLVVSTILILSVLMSVHLMPDKVSLHLGDVSSKEITAPRSAIFVNSVGTAQAYQAARLATPAVYDLDERAGNNAIRIVNELFDRVERARKQMPVAVRPRDAAANRSLQTAVRTLQGEFGNALNASQINTLLTLSPAVYQRLR